METTNSAIQYIWSDLHTELKQFINHKVKNNSVSEDILQEVFIKIHVNLFQLKDSSKLTAWVYQITRNTIADFFRQQKGNESTRFPELPETEEQDNLYQSLGNCINGKIAKLSQKDKEAVLLTYFKNYSQKELAAFLGMSYSGTKNRIQRAREKLKISILNCENVKADANGKITDFTGE